MIPTNPIPEVPNYGSSAQYKDLPSPEQIRAGVIPLDSLPAAWWNAMWACTNTAVNDARSAVGTLINEICNAITGAGICINESCIDQLYQAIDTIRQRIGNAVTAGAVKSSSCCGEVSIDANGIMTANGVGNAAQLNTTSKVVVGAINELKSTYDCCFSDLSGCITSVNNSKAPTSHVSSDTTYGVGNADCYGHLKISDTYDCCVGSAADGVAASQQALYCVYCAISEAASLGNSAACPLGMTAAAGTSTTAARSDHVHPYPSCFGNVAEGQYVRVTVANNRFFLSGDYIAPGSSAIYTRDVAVAFAYNAQAAIEAECATCAQRVALIKNGLVACWHFCNSNTCCAFLYNKCNCPLLVQGGVGGCGCCCWCNVIGACIGACSSSNCRIYLACYCCCCPSSYKANVSWMSALNAIVAY